MERFIDWRLAERVAEGVAGNGASPEAFSQEAVESACEEARELVFGYTRMTPERPLPPPEVVDRAEWVRVGLGTLREVSGAFETKVASGMKAPGPLGGVARSVAGAAAGAEAGLAVGYGARKVLGQYDVALTESDRVPRLLFVGPNLATTHQQLGETPEVFLRWIAIHETTHAVQFTSVPWLREHLASLLEELVEGAVAKIDRASLQGMARRIFRTARRSRAGPGARPPPGGDVGNRGSRRARHGRSRGRGRAGLRPTEGAAGATASTARRPGRGDLQAARYGAEAPPVQGGEGVL